METEDSKEPESPEEAAPAAETEAPADAETPSEVTEETAAPTAEAAPEAEAKPEGEGEEGAETEPLLEVTPGGLSLKDVAEALVFASPKPITTKEIIAALKAAAANSEDPVVLALAKAKASHVVSALRDVAAELEATGRAFKLVEKISGWVLVSDPACAAWVRQLYPEAKPTRLTGPQLETLAIIAYRQPVTRADIEAVRGVAVDGVMQVLLDRSLVKIAGRAEVPGRPLLYATTDYFLEHFGLKTTDELPNASELKRVQLPTAAPAEEKAAAPATAEGTSEAPSTDAAPAETAAEAPAEETPSAEPEPAAEPEAPAEDSTAPESTEGDTPQ